jgi:DNA repair protein RadC
MKEQLVLGCSTPYYEVMSHFVTSPHGQILLHTGGGFLPKNIHENHRSRMKERYIKTGLNGFAHHEALELLLYYSYPRQNTNEIAHRMIAEFGGLHNLLEADPLDIQQRCNTTLHVAILLNLIPQMANVYIQSRWERGTLLNTLKAAVDFTTRLFVGYTREVFYIICLDAGYAVKHVEKIAIGTLNQTTIYPRDLLTTGLLQHTAAVIITHNHPGGTIKPSDGDDASTKRVIETLEMISISVVDHIIIAGKKFYSYDKSADPKDGVRVKGYEPVIIEPIPKPEPSAEVSEEASEESTEK